MKCLKNKLNFKDELVDQIGKSKVNERKGHLKVEQRPILIPMRQENPMSLENQIENLYIYIYKYICIYIYLYIYIYIYIFI